MRIAPLAALLLTACGPRLLEKPAALDGDLEDSSEDVDSEADAATDDEDDAAGDDDDDHDDDTDTDVDASVDSDGDGISDAIEEQYGSDPNDPDSDGDGWDDGVEVDENTNPMSASDHPYTGGWPIDACRNDLNSSGNGVGQVAFDFELVDQYGDTVRLHDFCGQAVMLVASAMWCGPCQQEASELASIYQQYSDDGFIVITLLGEDVSGNVPNQADLQEWADAFGIQHPVVADPGFGVGGSFVNGGTIYLPSTSLLGEGAEVLIKDSYVSTNDIVGALP